MLLDVEGEQLLMKARFEIVSTVGSWFSTREPRRARKVLFRVYRGGAAVEPRCPLHVMLSRDCDFNRDPGSFIFIDPSKPIRISLESTYRLATS